MASKVSQPKPGGSASVCTYTLQEGPETTLYLGEFRIFTSTGLNVVPNQRSSFNWHLEQKNSTLDMQVSSYCAGQQPTPTSVPWVLLPGTAKGGSSQALPQQFLLQLKPPILYKALGSARLIHTWARAHKRSMHAHTDSGWLR